MQPTLVQSLDFYIDLLTPEGYDNYFRQFERGLVLGIEEYSEILKIDKPNGLIITRDLVEFESVDNEVFEGEFSDSIPLESGSDWFDVNNYFKSYIDNQARLVEKKIEYDIGSDIRLASAIDHSDNQIPFLLGYMALLNRMLEKSSISYKSTLFDSLIRLDQLIKRSSENIIPVLVDNNNPSSKAIPDENRLEMQWVEPAIGFTHADITIRKTQKCINAVYEDLRSCLS
jgi:hypothetical protein